jgi:hypothetical protein
MNHGPTIIEAKIDVREMTINQLIEIVKLVAERCPEILVEVLKLDPDAPAGADDIKEEIERGIRAYKKSQRGEPLSAEEAQSLKAGIEAGFFQPARSGEIGMMSNVFHFTDTMRLPWILDADELRPGTASRINYKGLPLLNFVWGTSAAIANTAQLFWEWTPEGAVRSNTYEAGLIWLVRFTLSDEDFVPWPDALKERPEWADRIEHMNTLSISQGDNPEEWWTHSGSLDRSKWLAIDAKSYDGSWRNIRLDLPVQSRVASGQVSGLQRPEKVIKFGGYEFSSIRLNDDPMTYAYKETSLLQ